jgi:hypothetical protein
MRWRWLLLLFAVAGWPVLAQDAEPIARPARPRGAVTVGGPVAPDGKTEVTCDLPVEQRIKNIGSRIDRAGMCVATSWEMNMRYQGLDRMRGFRDWCAGFPGGGYPTKLDQQIRRFCQEKSVPVPDYLQYEGRDPSILRDALRSGRMVAVTYNGRDGVRYPGPIAHMVCLIHLDDRWACLLDNNGIQENELLWMSPADFLARWTGTGSGWAVVFLAPPPPPVPRRSGE